MNNLVDEVEAAQYLCLSRSFLRQARVKGTGPIFRKFGRAVRYHISDLDIWIEKSARQNTIQLKGRHKIDKNGSSGLAEKRRKV